MNGALITWLFALLMCPEGLKRVVPKPRPTIRLSIHLERIAGTLEKSFPVIVYCDASLEVLWQFIRSEHAAFVEELYTVAGCVIRPHDTPSDCALAWNDTLVARCPAPTSTATQLVA